ncbi:MAG: hypothetical protein ABL962_17415 [Fimbriimonadaceae bacterium]
MKSKAKMSWGCRVLAVGCVAAALFVMSPLFIFVGSIIKAGHDVKNARTEFKRTVKPEELRAWVLNQLKKYPRDGFNEKSAMEWPASFPNFPTKRFLVYLDHDHAGLGPYHVQGASISWRFFDQGFGVTVLVKPDGSPAEAEHEQEWAKGISFDHFSK